MEHTESGANTVTQCNGCQGKNDSLESRASGCSHLLSRAERQGTQKITWSAGCRHLVLSSDGGCGRMAKTFATFSTESHREDTGWHPSGFHWGAVRLKWATTQMKNSLHTYSNTIQRWVVMPFILQMRELSNAISPGKAEVQFQVCPSGSWLP